MDGRAGASGGWGAMAVGGLALLGAVCEVLMIQAAGAGDPFAARGPGLALAAVTLGTGFGVLAAVWGVRRALRPTGRVVRAASWAGASGAAALVAQGLLGGYGLLDRPRPIGPALLALGLAGAALTAVWAIAVSAAAWKVHRLPAWVRVAGAMYGVLAIANLVLPMLRALTLLSALVWWFGLGAALLALARRPPAESTFTGKETA